MTWPHRTWNLHKVLLVMPPRKSLNGETNEHFSSIHLFLLTQQQSITWRSTPSDVETRLGSWHTLNTANHAKEVGLCGTRQQLQIVTKKETSTCGTNVTNVLSVKIVPTAYNSGSASSRSHTPVNPTWSLRNPWSTAL